MRHLFQFSTRYVFVIVTWRRLVINDAAQLERTTEIRESYVHPLVASLTYH